MNLEKARFNMVEQQIRPWQVLDQNVLDLLMKVRREDYVPENARAMAFTDVEIPIGSDQIMFKPAVEAKALQAVQVKPDDNALEIGAGTGFFASLLAATAAQVTTVEIDSTLAQLARDNLAKDGVQNVTVETGDGIHGWSKAAPYDIIVVSGGLSRVPQEMLDQLKPGGRLFAFVGEAPVMQACLITREADGSFRTDKLFETQVPMLRGNKLETFQF